MSPLKELLIGIRYAAIGSIEDVDIDRIVTDSRIAKKGDLFVAIRGVNCDGHDFAKEAVGRGAACLVLEDDMDLGDSRRIIVKGTKETLAILARNFYGNPSKDIGVIGITGTNGKTTLTYLLDSIFAEAGLRTGVVGTIRYKIDNEEIDACNTTPSALVLQGLLKRMVRHSLDKCVMEVSSHALDQRRTDCIDFDGAILTNVTSEHLDYHETFANYLDTKLQLFNNIKSSGYAVLNLDDPNFANAKEAASRLKVSTFGLSKEADVYAASVELGINGTVFTLNIRDKSVTVRSNLIGLHNVCNMLGAASCAAEEGVNIEKIKQGLQKVDFIPGRLQRLDMPNNAVLFVDYAHTDDALKKVLTALRAIKKKSIITVFGCGGNRDKTKRPRMGKAAQALSDYVIITSDNPRDEDPNAIARDITAGISNFADFEVIPDRRKAIEAAITKAQAGDIVLLAGKGHEKYQVIKERNVPFDDMETVKELLKERCLV